MKMNRWATCVVGALLIGAVILAQAEKAAPSWPDPERFRDAIAKFEQADAEAMPPSNAVVCIGSSSMRGWHGTIREDLAPLEVIPRGFGGSTMNDALYYVDRIVIPYHPRAVVVYEGDNDVAGGMAPEQILEAFTNFAARIHAALPATRIYVISIKPSIRRWAIWPQMQAANALLRGECGKDARLYYIDCAAGMLLEDGEVRKDIFKNDNLHMNRKGYEIWRDTARPILLQRESQEGSD
jgi:lysophospholipase L1-like esterase